MADYSGYFLQGLAGGIQSGINMGTQLQEMRWQKKQRKELEEKQAKMMEVSNLWNAKIKEAGADNIYSDEEIAQISTIYLSGGYEFMEHYQGAMNAIKSMNKAKYDQEKEWMDLFVSGVEGLPPGDIQAMYEYVQPYVTSEKGKNALEAYNNILQKRGKIAQAQPTAEVFTTAEAVQEAYPGQGYKYDTTAKGYIPTYQKPEELSATDKKYNWAIDNYKAGNISFEQLSKFMGTDISDPEKRNTIQQRLDEMDKLGATTKEKKNYLLGKSATTPPEEEPVKRTDIEYWRNRENTVKSEEDWDRYLFDLKQSKSPYKTKDATWEDRLLRDVKDLESGIKNQLLDKEGKMKLLNEDGTPKEIYFGGKKMTVEEAYTTLQKLYEEKVRELMEKYPDVADISTLVKFLSLEEVGKVTGWDWISRAKGYKPGETKDVSLISKY